MNYNNSNINSNIDRNRIEFVENKFIVSIEKFWQFSRFYGDYLASLHSSRKH